MAKRGRPPGQKNKPPYWMIELQGSGAGLPGRKLVGEEFEKRKAELEDRDKGIREGRLYRDGSKKG